MKRRVILFLASFVVLLCAAAFMGDRALRHKGHPGLKKFLHQWWVNYPASFQVEPEEVALKVDQADMDAIQGVVDAARERGVIMREGNDYVPAEFTAAGTTFKVKVRIKGKMADHVTGDKWSFRVIAKKDQGFKGMQRFSLQHPGTRNYLCDWFYHRLMRGEGVVALRYGFVRLTFNGEDLGVYAYEEHFGPELLANNSRMKGPIFRFDPGLFWEHRLNMIEKVRYNEAFAAYQAAAVDAFGSGGMEKDTVQLGYFADAVGRMMAFRRGDLTASEVFDADLIARRHAILDLVGGHHSMDWSDVKFYYDPVLRRVEPIAYESFSAFPIRTLAGSDRYVGTIKPSMDLHDAYFNDPQVFAAYVHHLERVSRPEFLDSAFTALTPALDSASAIIYREFPYKELDREVYRRNQLVIRRMLDVPKGFHAYAAMDTDTLRITVIPIEGLPIEVFGALTADGRVLPPAQRVIIPCRRPGTVGMPVDLRIPLDEGWRNAPPDKLILRYTVLGASTPRTLEAFPYAYSDGLSIPSVVQPVGWNARTEALLRFNDVEGSITIPSGVHTVDHDIFIPAGYTVNATSPLRIDLVKGARIISRSPMRLLGLEEMPVIIGSSDASGGGLVVLSTGGRSRFDRVRIEGFGGNGEGTPSIILQEAPSTWTGCDLGEVRNRDLMEVVRSQVEFNACTFTGGEDQLTLGFANASFSDARFLGAGDDALKVKGGAASMMATTVAGAMGHALVLDEAGLVRMDGGSFSAGKDVLAVSEGSTLELKNAGITSGPAAPLDVEPMHARHGPSQVVFQDVAIQGARSVKVGRGNNVSVNGGTISPTSKP